MGIRFACHACQHRLNIKNQLAGKKGKCPACGTRFRIPPADQPFSIPLAEEGRTASAARSDREAAAPAEEPEANREPADEPTEVPAGGESSPPTNPLTSDPTPAVPATPAPPPPPPPPPTSAATADDPLATDPQVAWYVRPPSGGQYGPAGGELLRSWIAEGRVDAGCLLWRSGWSQWRAAPEVLPELALSPAAGGSPDGLAEVSAEAAAATTTTPPVGAAAGTPSSAAAAQPAEAEAAETVPIGALKRRRKTQRIMTIAALVGLALLLLLALLFVIVQGLGGDEETARVQGSSQGDAGNFGVSGGIGCPWECPPAKLR